MTFWTTARAAWSRIALAIIVSALLHGCPGERTNPSGSDRVVILVDGPARPPEAGSRERSLPALDTKSSARDIKPWLKPDTKAAADAWAGSTDIGKPCTNNPQCQFGFCATNTHTGVMFCTKICNRCDSQPCPTGSGCQNAGIAYICAPGYPNEPCP